MTVLNARKAKENFDNHNDYFERLSCLGDFAAANHEFGGYNEPFLDFGISEIHDVYYYVIGKIFS